MMRLLEGHNGMEDVRKICMIWHLSLGWDCPVLHIICHTRCIIDYRRRRAQLIWVMYVQI